MREEVGIGDAAAGDAAAIAALHSASWRDAYAPLLPRGALPATLEGEHRALWERVLAPRPAGAGPGTRVLVAWADGRLAGFAAVHGCPEDPALDFLAALHVRPGLRDRGIGARLLRAMVEARRDAGRVRLWCWVLRENLAGRRFYARLGAVEGRRQTVPLTGTTDCTDIRLDFPPWPALAACLDAALAHRPGAAG